MANKRCVIVGAGHAGVACAFALRQHGWNGGVTLVDTASDIPYQKPPLSKTHLTQDSPIELLKSEESYNQFDIELRLGEKLTAINAENKTVALDGGKSISYDKLVLALGAKALIPNIDGIKNAQNIFALRNLADAQAIKNALKQHPKEVLIIGGGYIGLEIAASLRKLNKQVTLLERESAILSRVTSTATASFFHELHINNGVQIHTNKAVVSVATDGEKQHVICSDGTEYSFNMLIVGVGAVPEVLLANQAGLDTKNGILVDAHCKTSDDNSFAIGDCTNFYHPTYQKNMRLESVQNATDQAKIAAKTIVGEVAEYNALPWFWSDQYDVKLQIAGLSIDYDEAVSRTENTASFSVWYLKNNILVAVDAMNHPRAYMLGTKLIKDKAVLDSNKIKDSSIALSGSSFLKQ